MYFVYGNILILFLIHINLRCRTYSFFFAEMGPKDYKILSPNVFQYNEFTEGGCVFYAPLCYQEVCIWSFVDMLKIAYCISKVVTLLSNPIIAQKTLILN